MKTIVLISVLSFAFLLTNHCLQAQSLEYPAATMSFRYGPSTIGGTATAFINQKSAISIVYSSRESENRNMLNLLFVEHFRFKNIRGLNWYVGAGLYAGSARTTADDIDRRSRRDGSDVPRDKKFIWGTSAVAGVCYKLPAVPFIIGLDVKPYVDFVNGESSISDAALSIRFCF